MKKNHKKNGSCNCDLCNKTLEEVRDFEINSINKYGFFVHIVPSGKDNDYSNYHTHGLEYTKDHLDLQIVLPIDPKMAHGVFWSIVNNINEGKVYKENNFYDGIIAKYKVLFLKVRETGRDVLRVILPDPNGLFPDDEGCEPIYKGQKFADVEYCVDEDEASLN